jgi:NADH-quinone oxidoreductase subunit C/D
MMTTMAPPEALLEFTGQLDEAALLAYQQGLDGIPTLWISKESVHDTLQRFKSSGPHTYPFLYDLTAIDERERTHREGQPPADFTVVYLLLSFERKQYVRIKTPLMGAAPSLPTITDLWPSAAWYEREVYDMFGISFENHHNLRRILMPRTWSGHPLRKEHPARATEMGPFRMLADKVETEQEALRFDPERFGLQRSRENSDFMFLNLGPQHPGTHGVLRIIMQLDGEEVVDCVPEIGFHHRGAEKMGERQSWHSYIPYTDRIDYLGGVLNNLPYVLAVEKLAGIVVPDRVKVVRVMMCELFRIASHLVWFGTFAQDIGQMSPVFFTFNDRERIFDIVEAVCGGRMHPSWFRIGGVAQDLPDGWEPMVRGYVAHQRSVLAEYHTLVLKNALVKARTVGIGDFTTAEAIDWGATGPNLRATGSTWDFRKELPYSGYEQFDFEVPIGAKGDCYDRAVVHFEEIRQSLRIIEQCADNMPAGPYKADHRLTTPPLKERTMHDIETLITHFLNVSWGPVIPAGEAFVGIEAAKGANGYYLISDGSTMPYRVRIRTPSFAHMQMLPLISRGFTVADMLAILGAMDFVLADIDR